MTGERPIRVHPRLQLFFAFLRVPSCFFVGKCISLRPARSAGLASALAFLPRNQRQEHDLPSASHGKCPYWNTNTPQLTSLLDNPFFQLGTP